MENKVADSISRRTHEVYEISMSQLESDLLNRIKIDSQPPEDIIIDNYASDLPKSLGMFVK